MKRTITTSIPALPDSILNTIQETITKNASRCLDPIKAKGNCLRMSDELMLNLADVGLIPFVDCQIIFRDGPKQHFWVCVHGWHIDLTAKQFNESEPCPKIWRHEDVNLKNLYVVKKGKGKVLFKLEALHQREEVVVKLKKAFRTCKLLLQPLVRTINNVFHWPKHENSF